MHANYVQRLRFRFSTGPARYISHLDRPHAGAGAQSLACPSPIPGFNRRPRLWSPRPPSFHQRGGAGDWLLEVVELAAAHAQMMSRMAPGIVVREVWRCWRSHGP